ncbi:Acetamidase OS=Lysinibacillus sphaericus OX=1421 GN=LS41612_21915 PE=4 SV=1 [Lysinibacillus sphaericus]
MISDLQMHEKANQPENDESVQQPKAVETLFVNDFIDGILDPQQKMLGHVKNGGTIIANTTPGCWGRC